MTGKIWRLLEQLPACSYKTSQEIVTLGIQMEVRIIQLPV